MKKIIVSKSSKRRVSLLNGLRVQTQMVIYKEEIGTHKNGKPKYKSRTRHEPIYE